MIEICPAEWRIELITPSSPRTHVPEKRFQAEARAHGHLRRAVNACGKCLEPNHGLLRLYTEGAYADTQENL
jgi:hypothetical protein